MLRNLLKKAVLSLKPIHSCYPYTKLTLVPTYKSLNNFSAQKQLAIKQETVQNIDVKTQTRVVDGGKVEMVRTKGAISILDQVPGVKAEDGQMYILSFRCTKCEVTSIRSFTKHAYHKGVVLVRCGGCQNIHLVSDNLGWFEDHPVNVQTMHGDKLRKVHDLKAIAAFLQTAFATETAEPIIDIKTNITNNF